MATSLPSRRALLGLLALAAVAVLLQPTPAGRTTAAATALRPAMAQPRTATPIEHLIVIYQENSSFDRLFATYPYAVNPPGQPAFHARPGTPSVNGLIDGPPDAAGRFGGPLLTNNPNLSNPFRIDRTQAYTCDQDHEYTEEQRARNGGLMDQFVQHGAEGPGTNPYLFCHQNAAGRWDTDMGHFDGNTVTAIWNYAQHFAVSDNHFATMYGQSTRGVVNLVAGDVYGAVCGPANPTFVYTEPGTPVPRCDGPARSTAQRPPANGDTRGTLIDDVDPYWDICSSRGNQVALSGRNIGEMLTAAGVTWGWFQGGFALPPDGDCQANRHGPVAYFAGIGTSPPPVETETPDYIPHHNPFQYYAATANPLHTPPASLSEVGRDGPANHNYDITWFMRALEAGALPAVSFLKAPAYQDGHPGYSNPLDEQVWLVTTLNAIQRSAAWPSTAVIIAWDDSDGWYDHVMPPLINRSNAVHGVNQSLDAGCGAVSDGPGGRCGYGPRLPLLVISPYARENFVTHRLTDQTSILRLIEDNWLAGERVGPLSFDRFAGSLLEMFDFSQPPARRLILHPISGQPVTGEAEAIPVRSAASPDGSD